MSLECYIGPEKNLLEVSPEHCHRLLVDHPILTNEEVAALKHLNSKGWKSRVIDITFDRSEGKAGLQETLTAQARAGKTLVNVEDVKPLCDFHVPALVRRGALLLTVSTGGKSPGLARGLKAKLEEQYPAVWAERLDVLSDRRERWRAEGAGFSELIERTNQLIEAEGWLS